MRVPASIAMALLMAAAVAQEKTPREQPGASAARVNDLRKERIAALHEAADVSLKLAQNARVEVREALDDRVALLTAELDAAGEESGRAAPRKRALDALKAMEELAQARAAHGRGTQLDVLRVKARRLEVEMQVEQAKVTAPK